jgi:hypothetical protein
MGNAVATFLQESPVRYVDSDQLDLVLTPTDVTLDAGSNQTVSLTVMNFSGRAERFDVDVSGIAADWWKMVMPDGTSPPAGQLPQVWLEGATAPVPHPTATAKLSLVLIPPRRADARARIYPSFISAMAWPGQPTSQTYGNGPANRQTLRIPPADPPADPWPGARSRLRLGICNDGNAPAVVSIVVDADKNLEATLSRSEITLPTSTFNRADRTKIGGVIPNMRCRL